MKRAMPSLPRLLYRVTASALLLCGAWSAQAQPKDLVAKAQKGDAVAQNELGKIYMSGKGVAANPKEAFQWFMRAAKQGLPNAQANVSQSYLLGLGVKEESKLAEQWAKKAADQNFAGGYHLLGLVNEHFYSLNPAEDEALKYFLKAAQMDFVPAQFKYGERILGGGPKYVGDPQEGEKWLLKAAEQGYEPAQHAIGTLYTGRAAMEMRKPAAERCKWFYAAYAHNPTDSSPSHDEVQRCNQELSRSQIDAIQATLPPPLQAGN